MAESDKVVNAVMRATGESYGNVSELCMVAHETVDECVTDDISVVAPPLVIGRLGCPVLDRLLLRLGDGQWQLPESVDVNEAELSLTLMLPIETIARYPMIGRFGLLARCMDRLLIPDDDAERSLKILDAWLMTFAPSSEGTPAPYPVWALPGRDAFEGWLLARLDLLHQLGYAVRLANEEMDGVRGQQHMFVDGRRADLLLRFTADCDKGKADDWLVLENKTTAVGHRRPGPARPVGGLARGRSTVPARSTACSSPTGSASRSSAACASSASTTSRSRPSATAGGCASTHPCTRRPTATRLPSTTHRTCRRAPWWVRFAERSPYRRKPPPVPHDWRGFLMPVGHLS